MAQTRAIAILGMHRSGTSCLAGSLQAAGLELGEVFTHNPHNRKGNREHPDIMALHEAVLADNRASWHLPPPGPALWSPALAMRRREIIERFRDDPVWGFKDPRTLLTLEGWQEDLPNMEPVGIFRAPQAVAASLVKRTPALFDTARALSLWRDYNRRLLAEWRRHPFPLIEFVKDVDTLRHDLAVVARALGLPRADNATTFFEAGLQNQSAGDIQVDSETAELYTALQQAAKKELPLRRDDLAVSADVPEASGPAASETGAFQRPGEGLKPGDAHYRAYVGPPANYDVLAALQFNLMTALGLRDHHHLLDVGCGSLRAGRLFIPYLLPGRYCGLEPEAWLIEQGIENETGRAMIELKTPQFDHNRDFNFAVFGRHFDFILAQSVLTHAGRDLVRDFFAATRECLATDGIAAVTYIRGREDHPHDGWLYPGITCYTTAFMAALVADAGLELLELDWGHPGNIRPKWLAVGHPGLSSRVPQDLIAHRGRQSG